MQQAKDYDATMAQMAGNIAAGLVSGNPELLGITIDHVVNMSVGIAELIVERLKQHAASHPSRASKET